MPTYEYVCSACQNHWEEVQKISEPPVEVCPKCGESSAKRQISGGNFILKGGGWYADLYSSQPKPKADTGTASPSPSTSPAKTETPAATPAGGSGGSSGTGGSSGAAS